MKRFYDLNLFTFIVASILKINIRPLYFALILIYSGFELSMTKSTSSIILKTRRLVKGYDTSQLYFSPEPYPSCSSFFLNSFIMSNDFYHTVIFNSFYVRIIIDTQDWFLQYCTTIILQSCQELQQGLFFVKVLQYLLFLLEVLQYIVTGFFMLIKYLFFLDFIW